MPASPASLDRGVATIRTSLDRLVKKDKLSEADAAATIARVSVSQPFDANKNACSRLQVAEGIYPVRKLGCLDHFIHGPM